MTVRRDLRVWDGQHGEDIRWPELDANPLTGRIKERHALDLLMSAVRAGQDRVLVVHGEPGVGKTALLDYVSGQADGCRVMRVAGSQSESELAFAGLHQLCAPMLSHLEALPAPQRDALRTVFGISHGPSPDQFLIGLAVLRLLSEATRQQPVVCVVDDYQWLDQASASTLGFVARRLAAQPVGLVFGVRVPDEGLTGLPRLPVTGLREADARALLDSTLIGALDSRVKELIIAEARGNPLALLELARGLTPERLAGGFGLPDATPLPVRIEDSFRRQLDALPSQSLRFLQVAAAEPSGDPLLVWRAAALLGIPADSAEPALQQKLLQIGAAVRFCHPQVRSAAYHSTSAEERRRIHATLAEVSDPASDPDRLAWHRAEATVRPDEDVAAELERSAGRARSRGGLSAAAAFLERAALLTPDPGRRVARALAAAEFKHQAGASDAAAKLLAIAEAGPLDERDRARVSLLRGRMSFSAGRGKETTMLLLDAAQRYEALDPRLAREAYLEALSAALRGHGRDYATAVDVAQAIRRVAAPSEGRACDLLLEGIATLVTDGYAAGVPAVRRAIGILRGGEESSGESSGEQLRLLFLAGRGAISTWDDESWRELAMRQIVLARAAGALSQLPFALTQMVGMHLHAGELTMAASLVQEISAIKKATSAELPDLGAMALAACEGRDADAFRLINETISDMTVRGRGFGAALSHYTASLLHNGLGEHKDALAAAELAASHPEELAFANMALVELIEAAVRCGRPDRATAAMERLIEVTEPCDTPWSRGVAARCRALLSEGALAERLYREAIACLSSAPARAELARAHLLYGEWLRGEDRRGEAREQLQIAHGMLQEMGMGAFRDRASEQLLAVSSASGARKVRSPRILAVGEALTDQEVQVARLARSGLSNPEIGHQLFISARTVQYHLGKVFTKLGITSRNELSHALSVDASPAVAAA
jgi:DNA-binding CsgD family transcriptional regulator/tetratricopeptide (TPR) repeat protein